MGELVERQEQVNHEQVLMTNVISRTRGVGAILKKLGLLNGFNFPTLNLSLLVDESYRDSVALGINQLTPDACVQYFADSASTFYRELPVNNIQWLPSEEMGNTIPQLSILIINENQVDDNLVHLIKASQQVIIIPKAGNVDSLNAAFQAKRINLNQTDFSSQLNLRELQNLEDLGINTQSVFTKN